MKSHTFEAIAPKNFRSQEQIASEKTFSHNNKLIFSYGSIYRTYRFLSIVNPNGLIKC